MKIGEQCPLLLYKRMAWSDLYGSSENNRLSSVTNCILQRWKPHYLPTQTSITVPRSYQEVEYTFPFLGSPSPAFETGWVFVTAWSNRVWWKWHSGTSKDRIQKYHALPHRTLTLGIQISWREGVQETHGEAHRGEELRIIAQGPCLSLANSQHQLARTSVNCCGTGSSSPRWAITADATKSHLHRSPAQTPDP